MKKIYALILSVLLLSGCVTFVDTLGNVQEAAIRARMTFQPVVDGICKEYAQQCKNEKQAAAVFTGELDQQLACDAYEQCYQVREYIISVFEHIQMLIADAEMSQSIGDSKGAEEALQKAVVLMGQIRDQLRQLGYLK